MEPQRETQVLRLTLSGVRGWQLQARAGDRRECQQAAEGRGMQLGTQMSAAVRWHLCTRGQKGHQ